MNEVSNPRRESDWKLKTDTNTTSDEQEIADMFNTFFITKIANLKEGLDKKYVEDPIIKLRGKLKNNNAKFNLKTVNKKKVEKTLKKMKKKEAQEWMV